MLHSTNRPALWEPSRPFLRPAAAFQQQSGGGSLEPWQTLGAKAGVLALWQPSAFGGATLENGRVYSASPAATASVPLGTISIDDGVTAHGLLADEVGDTLTISEATGGSLGSGMNGSYELLSIGSATSMGLDWTKGQNGTANSLRVTPARRRIATLENLATGVDSLGSAADLSPGSYVTSPQQDTSGHAVFDGDDDVLTGGSVDGAATLYLGVVVRTIVAQTDNSSQGIIGLRENGDSRVFLMVGGSNAWPSTRIELFAVSGGSSQRITYEEDIPADTTLLIEGVWAGANLSLFVDGTLVDSTSNADLSTGPSEMLAVLGARAGFGSLADDHGNVEIRSAVVGTADFTADADRTAWAEALGWSAP